MGTKGLRGLRWNRWERRRKGCYFKDRGFGGCPNCLGEIS
nr:MAG TPA: Reverse gyrase zinc finger [Caudoviricetes sp.]